MTLVDLLLSRGHTLRHKTADEWCGPCPSCGGDDRFVVFEQGGRDGLSVSGRWWCRNCHPNRGDYISLLMDFDGLSYKDACQEAGLAHDERPRKTETKRNKSETVSAVSLSEPWSAQADHVLSSARQGMKSPAAAEFFRDGRGLTGETCRALGFGWQTSDSFFSPEMWGLPKGKPLAVPEGAVLPIRRGGRVVSLLVRRRFPYIIPDTKKELWFHEVRGGAKVPFFCGPSGAPLVVCESILCAASVYQVSGGQIAALATLGASKRGMDSDAVAFLKAASLVLIVADDDEAGAVLKKVVRQVRPDAEEMTTARDQNGEPFLKGNGKPAKDINDLCQVWRDDQRVFSWLAYGFTLALRRKEKQSVRPSSAEPEPEEPGEPSSDTISVDDDPLAADVALAREVWGDTPPMIAPDMPDWKAFCSGWYRDCFHCPYYDANPNSSPCALWEEAFPGVVTWHGPIL